jgi:hypothetical protein
MGQQKVAGFASAGIEADHLGAMQLALKMKKPMYGRYTAATNSLCFAGLVVDYHTAKGYTRRVLFPLVPHGAGVLQNARPWWGVFTTEGGAEPAYLIPVQLAETVSLDLGPYAPEGWDGRVLFGVALDSCGLDAGIEARIVRNGPPGPRLAKMPGLPPAPRAEKALGYFQGVNIFKFEDGAKMEGESVSLPARGLIEATGLGVATWKVRRAADSKSAELWINYQVEGGSYQLTKVPLADKVAPGGELKFDVDLKQHAPKGWSGRCRVRLVGNGVTAELIANSSFQIY